MDLDIAFEPNVLNVGRIQLHGYDYFNPRIIKHDTLGYESPRSRKRGSDGENVYKYNIKILSLKYSSFKQIQQV